MRRLQPLRPQRSQTQQGLACNRSFVGHLPLDVQIGFQHLVARCFEAGCESRSLVCHCFRSLKCLGCQGKPVDADKLHQRGFHILLIKEIHDFPLELNRKWEDQGLILMKTCLEVCWCWWDKTGGLETRKGGRGRREKNFCETATHFQMEVI